LVLAKTDSIYLDYYFVSIPDSLKVAYLDAKQLGLDNLAEWLYANKLGWGGRRTVGCSSWNFPSALTPGDVVRVVLKSLMGEFYSYYLEPYQTNKTNT
jgi:hypothetical protein